MRDQGLEEARRYAEMIAIEQEHEEKPEHDDDEIQELDFENLTFGGE